VNESMTHPALAAHLIPEVPGTDRIRGRSESELADAMTFLAWYAPGTFRAVMDYMDTVDGELIPTAM
jgi:acetoacetate decarboxylase